MANDKIEKLSRDEFFQIAKNENNSLNADIMYQTYDKLYEQMNDKIKELSKKNRQLAREKNKHKTISNKFNHSIDKKVRNRVIKLLKERYTQKEIAESVGISTSTVARIKKEEGITKKKLEQKNNKSEQFQE